MNHENATLTTFQQTLAYLLPSWNTVGGVFLLAVLAAVILSPLERLQPANQQPVLRRKGLLLDVVYWFLTPLVSRTITGLILAAIFGGVAYFIGSEWIETALDGFGPLSRQPLWLQAIEIMMIVDFVDYWTHRLFHERTLWPIHAIHHSSVEMSWLSSARVHPLNDLLTRACQILPLVVVGFSVKAIVALVPLLAFYVMFLHSNIKWDFGPLRWVLVSPAYHRWHHASDPDAIDKNFAGVFPLWDLLFGTYYYSPSVPQRYGVHRGEVPETLWGQLIYPFTKESRAVAEGAEVHEKIAV